MQLTLTYKGRPHTVDVQDDLTLGELKDRIAAETNVVPEMQKLLPGKGKVKAADLGPAADNDTSIERIGLEDGQKIMVLGTTFAELDQLHAQELRATKVASRRPHPSMARTPKARNTKISKLSPFSSVKARGDAPYSPPDVTAKVQAFLQRMAEDEAVLHVMELHNFKVGLLTELLPHEHDPSLRGLNEGAGQTISIRVRIDEDPHNLRDYRTCRQVLLHELAHNQVADHPPEFRELNSLLNRQVNNYEYSQRAGANRLTNSNVWALSSDVDLDADEKRARLAGAAESRIAALEAEIEQGECTHPAPGHEP